MGTEEIIKNEIMKFTDKTFDLNYLKIPITVIKAKPGNEESFNKIYFAIKNDARFIKWPTTKSGGLSVKKPLLLYNNYLYSVKTGPNYVDLAVRFRDLDDTSKTFRLQFRPDNYIDAENKKKSVTGRQSFCIFRNELARDGIDIEDYAVSEEEGLKLNEEIHKPMINIYSSLFIDRIFEHAHHLDFHKAYMSALAEEIPEFSPAIYRLAIRARKDPKYKTVLAATTGFFHSKICKYRFANLAKIAINHFYEKYETVYNELLKSGRHVIACNTDGIYYTGPIFHGIYESEDLGGWSNDLIDLQKLRFKSAGAYEYITHEGKYKAVVRGVTRLDKKKPREDWEWGDIYDYEATVLTWTFTELEGIIWHEII